MPWLPFEKTPEAGPATARDLLTRARRISPVPGIVATTGTVLAAVGLLAVAPWGPWNLLVLAAAGGACVTLLHSWAGPFWGRRR